MSSSRQRTINVQDKNLALQLKGAGEIKFFVEEHTRKRNQEIARKRIALSVANRFNKYED